LNASSVVSCRLLIMRDNFLFDGGFGSFAVTK
jgi:hypothetical protein